MIGMSNMFAGNDEIHGWGNGLDGVLESWEGPGAHIVISRSKSDDTNRVSIATAPESRFAHELNFSFASQADLLE